MEEASGLSKIDEIPSSPFVLFDNVIDAVKKDSQAKSIVMCIASINEEKGVLNRTVALVRNDGKGFVFITERNSRKFQDFLKNPATAATFLWIYTKENVQITRQIRINGHVEELTDDEIGELYKSEPLFAKIRCRICKCGEDVNWDELKVKHDEVLQAYRNGTDTLPQNDNYTSLRIIPSDFDFYYAKEDEIADRVFYSRENVNSVWTAKHIAA